MPTNLQKAAPSHCDSMAILVDFGWIYSIGMNFYSIFLISFSIQSDIETK